MQSWNTWKRRRSEDISECRGLAREAGKDPNSILKALSRKFTLGGVRDADNMLDKLLIEARQGRSGPTPGRL